ncbi:unnamed protein product [Candidula unifasciata]|uniref:KY-like immunoglobulin-like domain-containing protein n=1 Tax=Candidula unifasciata TaxID=100452 RepID=A0A8S3YN06_9EUPU|nr:unnamed protein product [Candidula unifasciata]
MASDRPDLPEGFLGAQPRFSELKLRTDAHDDAEIHISGDNNVIIKLIAEESVKVVTKLFQVVSDKELPDFTFIQRKDKHNVEFHVSFPENGWYKFMIFALKETDTSESLPNVYNYLIYASDLKDPAQGYAKTFTKFYADCCYLYEPLTLNAKSKDLTKVKFQLDVPNANKVAVHCVQEWFHLVQNDGYWEGTADLSKYRGKNSKVKVMANYAKDGNTYSALLEYAI